jgi:predicted ABC-type ATPase
VSSSASGRIPQAIVIAGPNGAGKTSAAPDLLRDTVGIGAFLNVDVIAEGLAAFDPRSVAMEAGRVMLRRIAELSRSRENMAFESTLSGGSVRRRLDGLRKLGYRLHKFYLWLPSPDLAVARVRLRVKSGGHDVPEEVIRRRFWRSLVNFDDIYRPLSDTWRLYDGTATGSRSLIAHGRGNRQAEVVDAGRWSEVRQQIEEHRQ